MAEVWVADMAKDGQTIDEINARKELNDSQKRQSSSCMFNGYRRVPRNSEMRRQACLHDLAVQSLGAAIQNLLLAAHAKGFGCMLVFGAMLLQRDSEANVGNSRLGGASSVCCNGVSCEKTLLCQSKKLLDGFCFVDSGVERFRILSWLRAF